MLLRFCFRHCVLVVLKCGHPRSSIVQWHMTVTRLQTGILPMPISSMNQEDSAFEIENARLKKCLYKSTAQVHSARVQNVRTAPIRLRE